MRQTATILAVILLAGGLAAADSLTINSMPYTSVRVVDVAKGKVVYEFNGRQRDKLLADVSYIQISGQRDFNKAEVALKAGKFTEAAAAYAACESSATKIAWLGRLLHYRRLQAAIGAKHSGQAVKDWLAIVDETGASRLAVMMVPEVVAAKGSAENAKAIKLLEKRVDAKGDAMLAAKVRDLLLALYAVEGLGDKAAILTAGAPQAPASSGNDHRAQPNPSAVTISVGRVSRQLEAAASQMKLGQYDVAVETIKSRLNRFSSLELPGALLLQGKALRLSYEKGGSKDHKKLMAAGLCFMRVVACFDGTPSEVPEALYLAAMVEKAAGKDIAANNALRMLVSRHATSEWAEKARAALSGPAAP